MSTLHRIALLGFSAFERNTLASYLRLASTREPRYEQVQLLPEADFVVADADHEPSVQLVLAVERLPETVFVGSRAPDGAIAWLARPIDPMRVLRELDALAARRMSPQAVPARATGSADAERRRTVIQPVRPVRPAAPPAPLLLPSEKIDLMLPDLPDLPDQPDAAQAGPRGAPTAAARSAMSTGAPGVVAAAAAAPVPLANPIIGAAPPAPRAVATMPRAPQAARVHAPLPGVVSGVVSGVAPGAAPLAVPAAIPGVDGGLPSVRRRPAAPAPQAAPLPGTALLVDDSDVALRFLERKLRPFGLVTECVSHADAAIERLRRRRYDFVFLDMELGEHSGLDGLGLCQHIKREPSASNVVMVTAHHTELDRVRGALAGCDGFLGKPLDEQELALYLARFGVRPAAHAGSLPS